MLLATTAVSIYKRDRFSAWGFPGVPSDVARDDNRTDHAEGDYLGGSLL